MAILGTGSYQISSRPRLHLSSDLKTFQFNACCDFPPSLSPFQPLLEFIPPSHKPGHCQLSSKAQTNLCQFHMAKSQITIPTSCLTTFKGRCYSSISSPSASIIYSLIIKKSVMGKKHKMITKRIPIRFQSWRGFHKQKDDVKKSQVLLPICCFSCCQGQGCLVKANKIPGAGAMDRQCLLTLNTSMNQSLRELKDSGEEHSLPENVGLMTQKNLSSGGTDSNNEGRIEVPVHSISALLDQVG